MTFSDSKNAVAALLKHVNSDFVINGVDLLAIAINSARRYAERLHDFRYAETNVNLSISSTGSPISGAFAPTGVTAAGTLSPNVAGAWAVGGSYNSAPFYTITVSTVQYFLFFTGTAWQIFPGGFSGMNGWQFATTSPNPVGTYTPMGTSTGALTISGSTSTVGIKKISIVQLPLNDGTNLPIEFMTNDEWLGRLKRQVGRTPYDATNTLADLGVSTTNPICYQQGQSLFLYPGASFSFPQTVTLNVTQWMPDYVNGTDTDFFLQYAPDFIMWRAIVEGNKLWKYFVKREEGDLDPAEVAAWADAALQALIAWDSGINQSTSTPTPRPPVGMPPLSTVGKQ